MANEPGSDVDFAALRSDIDALDRELLVLINRRAGIAHAIGEMKRAAGTAAFRPDREAAVIASLQAANAGPLADAGVAAIWREIMSACRALEAPVRVAYLGPAGTFSEQAAFDYFGSSIGRVSCVNVDEVFHAVGAGSADFGVVPVENSSEGVVTRSLDLFLATALAIVGETSLLIRHNLLRKVDNADGIEAVYGHPQALAQCHGWLGAHLPQAERRPVASNAEGARLASLDDRIAAIASDRAAHEFGLHAVLAGIQDDAHNRTRFAIIARADARPSSTPTGNDCTSLVVSVANKPGAVHDMLAPLKTHGVSMTRFESRPARSGQWEYYFHVDLKGHPDEPEVAAALDELRERCAFFKMLGAYPAAGS